MISRILQRGSLARGFGSWTNVPTTPPDPILGLNEKFKESKDPRKVNLTVGAYRDENGKPWILPCVKQAMKIVYENTTEIEYIPILGDRAFVAYGKDSKAIQEKRIAGAQTLSGCGAVYMGAIFLKKFWPHNNLTIYTTTPTWPIHNTLLAQNGIKNEHLPYYNPKTRGLDFENMCATLEKIPERQVIMLHSTAHNPTGVDPTPQQWKTLAEIFARKKHFAFFDMAYQGFASGELEKDNLSIRTWADHGLEFCVAQSFAKSMGLYGQRLGTFSVQCENSAEALQVQSQLATIARNTWSSPPRFGSDVARTILSDPVLYQQWLSDMRTMAGRIASMRTGLVSKLKEVGSQQSWKHITDQIGMFAFTGLDKQQSEDLINKHGVFLTLNGRISVAGLTEKNLEYVAKAFDAVTKNQKH